ncbi:hypothetical protein COCCADRAFT_90618 [Bipolaris zeicola 26-R-13]|uniref:Uncharacterized protein n=1 Tax=Cochliobolus carbonum (strain 26-R-13) TaxID=930089 RepID=W6YVH8_COCC2|nr:uncharacterized protein COCCADRAFT_90618 [Bipolaris zeicola 26-R-13]EUC35476.1 hypothetical protein COCCADRAFT_90618 [Bipolaris zeicola 26-R-13]
MSSSPTANPAVHHHRQPPLPSFFAAPSCLVLSAQPYTSSHYLTLFLLLFRPTPPCIPTHALYLLHPSFFCFV